MRFKVESPAMPKAASKEARKRKTPKTIDGKPRWERVI